jgi:predicted ATP-dependent protease
MDLSSQKLIDKWIESNNENSPLILYNFEKDLKIPDNVKNHLEIVPVRWIDKVLEVALSEPTKPLPEETVISKEVVAKSEAVAATDPVIKH